MKESSPTSFLTDGKSKYAATCNYPLNINRRMSEWIRMNPSLLPQRCAFPPCTNSFPRSKRRKKYCSGCCRVKDFNRRKNKQENNSAIPAARQKLSVLKESVPLAAPPLPLSQGEEPAETKKGMSLVGVGESAIGTAGVLLLKDQLFDKQNRDRLQLQLTKLLQQQAFIARQLQELKNQVNKLNKANTPSGWAKDLLL
jgi:hypothetical protein